MLPAHSSSPLRMTSLGFASRKVVFQPFHPIINQPQMPEIRCRWRDSIPSGQAEPIGSIAKAEQAFTVSVTAATVSPFCFGW